MNGLTLAYIGDAHYELEIRKYLVNKGVTKVNQLHNQAVKYTSSVAQAKIIEKLINDEILSEAEFAAFRRGRNNSTSGRRNVDAQTYVMATGFESLIGYLYYKDQKRLNEIIKLSIKIIEGGVKS